MSGPPLPLVRPPAPPMPGIPPPQPPASPGPPMPPSSRSSISSSPLPPILAGPRPPSGPPGPPDPSARSTPVPVAPSPPMPPSPAKGPRAPGPPGPNLGLSGPQVPIPPSFPVQSRTPGPPVAPSPPVSSRSSISAPPIPQAVPPVAPPIPPRAPAAPQAPDARPPAPPGNSRSASPATGISADEIPKPVPPPTLPDHKPLPPPVESKQPLPPPTESKKPLPPPQESDISEITGVAEDSGNVDPTGPDTSNTKQDPHSEDGAPAVDDAAKRKSAEAEEAKRKAEEEAAQLKAEEDAKRKAAEEAARLKAEEDAKRKAEEAKRKAEEEAKRKAEEEAKRKAEEEARKKAADDAHRKAEEFKKKAEEEAKRKAEEAAKRKAEEEAKRKAEEEAKRKAEEEAKRKAEEEAKRKAEEEAKRKAEEEAKRKAEEEAKRKAEEEAKRKAEEEAKQKAEADAKRKAEEEAKQKAEAEAKRKAEEEAKQKAEEEAKRKAEEEAKLRAEAEAKRKAEEEAKQKAEEEAKRKAEEEVVRLRKEEEHARALADAARKAEEKRKAEEQAREEAEQLKRQAAEEAARVLAEATAVKAKAEQEAARLRAETEQLLQHAQKAGHHGRQEAQPQLVVDRNPPTNDVPRATATAAAIVAPATTSLRLELGGPMPQSSSKNRYDRIIASVRSPLTSASTTSPKSTLESAAAPLSSRSPRVQQQDTILQQAPPARHPAEQEASTATIYSPINEALLLVDKAVNAVACKTLTDRLLHLEHTLKTPHAGLEHAKVTIQASVSRAVELQHEMGSYEYLFDSLRAATVKAKEHVSDSGALSDYSVLLNLFELAENDTVPVNMLKDAARQAYVQATQTLQYMDDAWLMALAKVLRSALDKLATVERTWEGMYGSLSELSTMCEDLQLQFLGRMSPEHMRALGSIKEFATTLSRIQRDFNTVSSNPGVVTDSLKEAAASLQTVRVSVAIATAGNVKQIQSVQALSALVFRVLEDHLDNTAKVEALKSATLHILREHWQRTDNFVAKAVRQRDKWVYLDHLTRAQTKLYALPELQAALLSLSSSSSEDYAPEDVVHCLEGLIKHVQSISSHKSFIKSALSSLLHPPSLLSSRSPLANASPTGVHDRSHPPITATVINSPPTTAAPLTPSRHYSAHNTPARHADVPADAAAEDFHHDSSSTITEGLPSQLQTAFNEVHQKQAHLVVEAQRLRLRAEQQVEQLKQEKDSSERQLKTTIETLQDKINDLQSQYETAIVEAKNGADQLELLDIYREKLDEYTQLLMAERTRVIQLERALGLPTSPPAVMQGDGILMLENAPPLHAQHSPSLQRQLFSGYQATSAFRHDDVAEQTRSRKAETAASAYEDESDAHEELAIVPAESPDDVHIDEVQRMQDISQARMKQLGFMSVGMSELEALAALRYRDVATLAETGDAAAKHLLHLRKATYDAQRATRGIEALKKERLRSPRGSPSNKVKAAFEHLNEERVASARKQQQFHGDDEKALMVDLRDSLMALQSELKAAAPEHSALIHANIAAIDKLVSPSAASPRQAAPAPIAASPRQRALSPLRKAQAEPPMDISRQKLQQEIMELERLVALGIST